MPGRDQTGPFGMGPVGRGLGPCGGGQSSRWSGRGFFRGDRWGWRLTPTAQSPEEERSLLEQQKSWLEAQIETITNRLQGLDKAKGNE